MWGYLQGEPLRWFGHEDSTLMNGISNLTKEALGVPRLLPPCDIIVKYVCEEVGPHQTLNPPVPWSQPLALFLLQATQPMVFCYSSPNRLRQVAKDKRLKQLSSTVFWTSFLPSGMSHITGSTRGITIVLQQSLHIWLGRGNWADACSEAEPYDQVEYVRGFWWHTDANTGDSWSLAGRAAPGSSRLQASLNVLCIFHTILNKNIIYFTLELWHS